MNKVILLGRLTKDPEVRYSQSATPVAVARYGLAVRRQFVKQGEPDVDFINIVAFGKAGEFAEKYFKKGQQVTVVGRLQVNTWQDQQGVKHTSYDVIVEEQHFAESKQQNGGEQGATSKPSSAPTSTGGYTPETDDSEDLPF